MTLLFVVIITVTRIRRLVINSCMLCTLRIRWANLFNFLFMILQVEIKPVNYITLNDTFGTLIHSIVYHVVISLSVLCYMFMLLYVCIVIMC